MIAIFSYSLFRPSNNGSLVPSESLPVNTLPIPAPQLGRRLGALLLLAALALLINACTGQNLGASDVGSQYSRLWGKSGELWEPASRLPDFSFAGYHMGEDPIPKVPVKLNVKDFGAIGDGVTDDSQAFLDAITDLENGALFIPAGRYRITQVLEIKKSNIVLRGEERNTTVLYFPNHLGDVLGPGGAPSGTRYYSWKDGFISVKGRETREKLTTVVAEASRGDKLLKVASTAEIKPGQMVRLSQSDSDDRSLLRHLHADELPGGIYSELRMGFVSRVAGVEGNTITLERPLRADVRLPWEPEIHAYVPSVQEVGIENLTLEFPQIKYGGHLNELGYNGIQVRNAANCWIRNLKFRNADNGIFLDRTKFCTVQGVYLGAYDGGLADAGRYGIASGHHALLVRGADDNLFTDFEIDTVFVHDITVDSGSSGNVFSQGKAIDLTLDHHKRAPFENLFTDIDVGEGTRLWTSGGSSRIGSPHSGARETFWNIRGKNSLGWPSHQSYDDQPWGPKQLNVVGITTNNPSIETPDGKWFEAIDPAKLVPQNLHLAQLANRLK